MYGRISSAQQRIINIVFNEPEGHHNKKRLNTEESNQSQSMPEIDEWEMAQFEDWFIVLTIFRQKNPKIYILNIYLMDFSLYHFISLPFSDIL